MKKKNVEPEKGSKGKAKQATETTDFEVIINR